MLNDFELAYNGNEMGSLSSMKLALILLNVIQTITAVPVYPLYAINSISQPNLTDEDLKIIATSFSYIQGGFTEDQLGRMRQINPNFGPVSYINSNTANARQLEPFDRFGAGYYLTGTLSTDITADSTSLVLTVAEGTSPLKASSMPGNFSGKTAGEYVTFIRMENELMRIDRVDYTDSATAENERHGKGIGSELTLGDDGSWYGEMTLGDGRIWRRLGANGKYTDRDSKLGQLRSSHSQTMVLHVSRGFGNTVPKSYEKGANVFTPLYNAEGFPEGKAGILYMIDPSTKFAVQRLVNHTLSVRQKGFSGSWFDCFDDTESNAVDVGGKRMHRAWNFETGSYYTAESYLAAQKKRLTAYWTAVHSQLSVYPLTLANNLFAGYWPEEGDTRSLLIPSPGYRPLDGYCMEAFIGGEMLDDPYHYGCNASALNFTWNDPTYWRKLTMKLMDSAQLGLPALPMISQAGCKSVKLEMMDNKRDQVENFGYASYLLAVNSSKGSTRFGLPAFYQENGRRFAHVHARYSWPIGEPEETYGPDDIDKYKVNGHSSYVRRFTNGLIIANPFNTTDPNLKLDKAYVNPDTGKVISILDVPAHTGFILLKGKETA